MAILYGVEVPGIDRLGGFAINNGLTIVQSEDKNYIGSLMTEKNCFRDHEVISLIEEAKKEAWHPRFIAYLKDNVRDLTSDKRYVPEVKLISFDYLNSRVILSK
ncbi:hypothetical protein D3C72_1992190 [compost metagenome]